jgi:hypothetical protein
LENLGLDREDNIKLDLKETGLEAEGWMHLVRMSTGGGLYERKKLGNIMTSWATISFSSRALHHGVIKQHLHPQSLYIYWF